MLVSAALVSPARTVYVSVDGPGNDFSYDENEGRWYYYEDYWYDDGYGSGWMDSRRVYIDGEPGDSWENAYSSIDSACDDAESGDTVLVGPGTYHAGPHISGDHGKNLVIRSVAGAEQTIIEQDNVDLGGTDRIIGFTIQNSSGDGLYGGYANSCVIRNCGGTETERSSYSGLMVEQYKDCAGAWSAILTDCVIENCLGGGAYSCTLDRCIVRNCRGNDWGGIRWCIAYNTLIIGNRAEVMDPADSLEGYCGGAKDSTLYNCTVVGNYAERRFGGVGGVIVYNDGSWTLGSECDVFNSIVVNNTCGNGTVSNYGQYNWGNGIAGSTFSYSCSYPKPAGTGNTGTAPRFANTTTYALASGSAGINAGNNAYVHGSYDLNGLPRIYGGRVDMGASESVAASQICTVHFDANGGLVEVDSMLCVIGSALGILPVPYREGFRFEGWFDDPDEEWGELATAQTTARGRNMYLYAHWSEETESPWQPVYRFYSKSYKGHFYTIDPEERATLMCTNPNWKYEGVAYYAATEQVQGTVPLHRFYSKNYRGHFFTVDEDEMWTLQNTNPNWRYEGVAFYVYPDRRSDPTRSCTPIYRFWSKRYRHHFFTIDEDEMWTLRETNPNWKYESVAFYACEDEP